MSPKRVSPMSESFDSAVFSMPEILTLGKASAQQVMIVCKVANMVDKPSDKSIAKNKIDQQTEPNPTLDT